MDRVTARRVTALPLLILMALLFSLLSDSQGGAALNVKNSAQSQSTVTERRAPAMPVTTTAQAPKVSTTTAPAPEAAFGMASASSKKRYVNTLSNVRSGPGTNYRIVATKSRGQAVSVQGTSRSGSWTKIGSSRWIYSKLLSAKKPSNSSGASSSYVATARRYAPSAIIVSPSDPRLRGNEGTYDPNGKGTLLLRSGMPMRTLKEVAAHEQGHLVFKRCGAKCQSIVLGALPAGTSWRGPTYKKSAVEAIANSWATCTHGLTIYHYRTVPCSVVKRALEAR
jgi:uncharacterized protein YraI